MRFSRYNILSKRLNNGDYVLLNSFSGLLDLIDEEVFDLISAHSKDEELSPEILDSMAEILDSYIERGYLTKLSSNEELEKAESLAHELAGHEENANWGVLIIPTLGCNYRCTYCFEQAEGYPEYMMSKKQVDAIFKTIKGKVDPGENITLYGGEPLQKECRELVQYILEKCKGIDNTIFAVSNGHDLDHYMDLLGSNAISSVQITVDGTREIHNRRRISLDKESSYDKILSNIKAALSQTDVQINLRINLDKRNAPYVLELLEDLDSRGFLKNERFTIAVSPVVGVGNLTASPGEIRELEKAAEEKYPQFRELLMNRTMISNKQILPSIFFKGPVTRRAAICGACGSMKIFAPDGRIYSCWSALGQPNQAVGTYDEDGCIIWNPLIQDKWHKTTLAYDKECIACRFAFLCGGGCRRPALPKEASAHQYDCEYYHNMFEDYLARVTDVYIAAGNG